MPPGHSHSRRSTISGSPSSPACYFDELAASPARHAPMKPGQCTHLTMTRLWTTDFTCQVCLHGGSMGWLYRCTQDRELLIENDMERGQEERLDEVANLLPRGNELKKGSPAARVNKLAFLDEISDDQLATYSTTQLSRVLKQRANVLDTANEPNITLFQGGNLHPPASGSLLKPWLPLKECQFKCCHICRPTLNDRSHLSLNGIMAGDVPATAVVGFGFHLQGTRPVGLASDVRNLGLRTNPPEFAGTSEEFVADPIQTRRRQFWMSPREPQSQSTVGLGLQVSTSELPFHNSSEIPLACQLSPTKAPEKESILYPMEDINLDGLSTQPVETIGVDTFTQGLAIMATPPNQSDEETMMLQAKGSSTPIETEETDYNSFGQLPLLMNDMTAVTEKRVDMQIPDVVLPVPDESVMTQI